MKRKHIPRPRHQGNWTFQFHAFWRQVAPWSSWWYPQVSRYVGEPYLETWRWVPILTPKFSKRTFKGIIPRTCPILLWKPTKWCDFLYSISIHLWNWSTLCLVLDILEEKDPHEHGQEETGAAKDEADCSRNYRWSCERQGSPPAAPWSFIHDSCC